MVGTPVLMSGLVAALTVAAAATAQDLGSSGAGPGGPEGGGRGRPSPPRPAQLATNLVAKFDADGTGALSADELTKALTDMQKHRPPSPRFQGETGDDPQDQPSAAEIAATWIKKFAADKASLTLAELTKALDANRPPHGPRKDIGSTKLELPSGAKEKLEASSSN
ncbi:MAG: hypothetical protein BWK77_04475 [Verrucomicrobia bacterium A1]|nr:MAG: hypothetical protein BWK77_04475 [Verrucomicrobia bacterium A1]